MMQVLEIQPKDLEQSKQDLVEVKVDPTFRALNKNSICFHIWKVEEDKIESVPKLQFGTFYNDCTYIVYASSIIGTYANQDTITREVKTTSNIERFIHFWLGSETTPSKSGNVAYKVMELDTHFGNIATQYRETQGNESSRFLSYFKKGMTVLSSKVKESNPEVRLYQVKGKKCIKCTEMDSISWDHFGSSYIMLLQTPKYVFIWIGRSSSPTERRSAIRVAKQIKERYKIPEITTVDDGYEQSMIEPRKKEWNQHLSLSKRFVNQIESIQQYPRMPLKLYKCGYYSGKYRIEELKTNDPEQIDLSDSNAAFIIDGGPYGVWAWIGKSTSTLEKVEAMRNARGFVKKKRYPSSTPVIRVIEGHEPVEFTRLFPTWKAMDHSSNKIPNVLGKIHPITLMNRPKMAAETQLIDDGTGEKQIFRITDGQYVELPRQKHVAFFTGDCYLLNYFVTHLEPTANNEPRLKNIVYLWCGKGISTEKRQKCENLACDYFKKLGNESMMVKLNEGLEIPHFLQIFNGRFVVFSGQGAEYDRNGLSSLSPSGFILKVFGDSTFNTKAVQQPPTLALSPKECFVIKANNVWVWCGQSSTGDNREMAKNIGNLLGDYTLVMEGKEPEEFWNSIMCNFSENNRNGFNDYDIIERYPVAFDKSRIGLYISYMDQNVLMTKEILGFEQADLLPEDIYLLDTGNMIYIWLGAMCANEEKEMCWVMAREHLQNYTLPRDERTAVALIRQGYEPNTFVGFFEHWDPNYWNDHATFEAMRLKIESHLATVASTINLMNGENDFDRYQKYPLSVLQQEADSLPTGIDPSRKEIHLTHDDFVSVFNMKFSEYETLPAWKKQQLKKKHKLF